MKLRPPKKKKTENLKLLSWSLPSSPRREWAETYIQFYFTRQRRRNCQKFQSKWALQHLWDSSSSILQGSFFLRGAFSLLRIHIFLIFSRIPFFSIEFCTFCNSDLEYKCKYIDFFESIDECSRVSFRVLPLYTYILACISAEITLTLFYFLPSLSLSLWTCDAGIWLLLSFPCKFCLLSSRVYADLKYLMWESGVFMSCFNFPKSWSNWDIKWLVFCTVMKVLIELGLAISCRLASILAVLTNSVDYMRKLIMYWILLSLLFLFEYASVNFMEWNIIEW